MKVILGSKSPRRKEILEFFTLPFTQVESQFDEENVLFSGDVRSFVIQVAEGKALELGRQFPEATILTADTVVYFQNKILLKPKTLREAKNMLRELSGNIHRVLTGVVVFQDAKLLSGIQETLVEFNELTDHQIDRYCKTIHCLDKAGGYAIQKSGSLVVKRIEGCYDNVMGLPIQLVKDLLEKVGICLWDYLAPV